MGTILNQDDLNALLGVTAPEEPGNSTSESGSGPSFLQGLLKVSDSGQQEVPPASVQDDDQISSPEVEDEGRTILIEQEDSDFSGDEVIPVWSSDQEEESSEEMEPELLGEALGSAAPGSPSDEPEMEPEIVDDLPPALEDAATLVMDSGDFPAPVDPLNQFASPEEPAEADESFEPAGEDLSEVPEDQPPVSGFKSDLSSLLAEAGDLVGESDLEAESSYPGMASVPEEEVEAAVLQEEPQEEPEEPLVPLSVFQEYQPEEEAVQIDDPSSDIVGAESESVFDSGQFTPPVSSFSDSLGTDVFLNSEFTGGNDQDMEEVPEEPVEEEDFSLASVFVKSEFEELEAQESEEESLDHVMADAEALLAEQEVYQQVHEEPVPPFHPDMEQEPAPALSEEIHTSRRAPESFVQPLAQTVEAGPHNEAYAFSGADFESVRAAMTTLRRFKEYLNVGMKRHLDSMVESFSDEIRLKGWNVLLKSTKAGDLTGSLPKGAPDVTGSGEEYERAFIVKALCHSKEETGLETFYYSFSDTDSRPALDDDREFEALLAHMVRQMREASQQAGPDLDSVNIKGYFTPGNRTYEFKILRICQHVEASYLSVLNREYFRGDESVLNQRHMEYCFFKVNVEDFE